MPTRKASDFSNPVNRSQTRVRQSPVASSFPVSRPQHVPQPAVTHAPAETEHSGDDYWEQHPLHSGEIGDEVERPEAAEYYPSSHHVLPASHRHVPADSDHFNDPRNQGQVYADPVWEPPYAHPVQYEPEPVDPYFDEPPMASLPTHHEVRRQPRPAPTEIDFRGPPVAVSSNRTESGPFEGTPSDVAGYRGGRQDRLTDHARLTARMRANHRRTGEQLAKFADLIRAVDTVSRGPSSPTPTTRTKPHRGTGDLSEYARRKVKVSKRIRNRSKIRRDAESGRFVPLDRVSDELVKDERRFRYSAPDMQTGDPPIQQRQTAKGRPLVVRVAKPLGANQFILAHLTPAPVEAPKVRHPRVGMASESAKPDVTWVWVHARDPEVVSGVRLQQIGVDPTVGGPRLYSPVSPRALALSDAVRDTQVPVDPASPATESAPTEKSPPRMQFSRRSLQNEFYRPHFNVVGV